jgi:hypothetical protein
LEKYAKQEQWKTGNNCENHTAQNYPETIQNYPETIEALASDCKEVIRQRSLFSSLFHAIATTEKKCPLYCSIVLRVSA